MNNEIKASQIPLHFNRQLFRGNEQKYMVMTGFNLMAISISALPDVIVVVIHDGMFHADDVVAVKLIEYFTGKRVIVIRSRNPEDFKKADIVTDVGEGNFDHHGSQDDHIQCASSKIYRLFYQTKDIHDQHREEWWDKVGNFVDMVARQDNGIEYSGLFPYIATMSKYQIVTGKDKFEDALDMTGKHIFTMFDLFTEEIEAEVLARNAINDQAAGDIVVFPEGTRAANVKKLLWDMHHPAMYFISPEANQWKVLCCAVPKESEDEEFKNFSSRQLIPQRFRGLSGKAFEDECKIKGAIFCNPKGFIAGFNDPIAAIQFAMLCLKELT